MTTVVPAVIFFAAALLCSLVGRVLLLGAAFGVSSGWGMAVLFAPFGPLFFRLKNPEVAVPKNYWGMATGPLMLLFFLDGGTVESIHSLTDFGKPRIIEASAEGTQFHLPVPSKVVAAALGKAAESPATTAPAPAPTAKATTSTTPATTAAAPAPAATPSSAVAAANTAMPTAPKILSPVERMEANRLEFARLAEWYDNLKHERGYLRKGDNAAVEAYNVEAAKYQAALQLARNEQAELAKLTAKK